MDGQHLFGFFGAIKKGNLKTPKNSEKGSLGPEACPGMSK